MNKKVSELASAVVSHANDLLLLVQNSISKSLTVANLFGDIATPVSINSTLNFGSMPTVVTSGAIPLNETVTHINLSSTQFLILGAGKEGQVKFLVAVSGEGTALINTNLWNHSITLDLIGDAVHMIYTGGRWAVLGGLAIAT